VTSIIIVNYGVGNLYSVKKGLEKAGAEVEILSDPAEVRSADAIVLPGVGAFAEAKKNLSKLEDVLIKEVENGKPLLGICLGLQLLFTKSYEGRVTPGLNLLKGEVVKLPTNVKLPQIGWNNIEIVRRSPILEGVPDNSYAYFVHSYVAKPDDENDVVAETEYGTEFPSILERGNVYATQFHPEKSSQVGLTVLRNFVGVIRK
jgi:glutamine amidotransferase